MENEYPPFWSDGKRGSGNGCGTTGARSCGSRQTDRRLPQINKHALTTLGKKIRRLINYGKNLLFWG